MKKVFTSPDPLAVHAVRGFLETNSIATCIIGEERLLTAGQVPPTECWLELHVYDDEDEAAACALVRTFTAPSAEKRTWVCPVCGERISPEFRECWRCAKAPPVPRDGETLFGALLIILGAMVLFVEAPMLRNLASALIEGQPVHFYHLLQGISTFIAGSILIALGVFVARPDRSGRGA